MLVFTLRQGKAAWIGDNCKLQVLSVDDNYVKVGFIAPKELEIDREEVRLKKNDSRKNQSKS